MKAESSVDRAGRAGMLEGVIRRGFLRRLTGMVPGTRIGRVRWPRALLMRPWRWHDGAGRPERAATTGKGPGDLVAVPMPEPGEPPVTRPTSAAPDQMEFVPQEPTRWLVPKLLVLIGVQVALSTKFAEFFDRRDAQTGVSVARIADATQDGDPAGGNRWSVAESTQGYDFTGAEEMWLDYVADAGDGFDATTTIAALVARDALTLPGPGPAGEHSTRAGAVLVLGGDQAYPFATMQEYGNRLVGPFRSVLPWTWHPRWLFAIPGNHDWYDGPHPLRPTRPGPTCSSTSGGQFAVSVAVMALAPPRSADTVLDRQ